MSLMKTLVVWSFIVSLGSLVSCSWPKVKIAGDEYLLAPMPGSYPVSTSTSGKDSGSGSSNVEPVEQNPENGNSVPTRQQ